MGFKSNFYGIRGQVLLSSIYGLGEVEVASNCDIADRRV